MDKKVFRKYTISVWDKLNIGLLIATLITSLIFIVLFILCFEIEQSNLLHSFILGMCGVFASLASAFFIAFYTRMYELKEKKELEQKALIVLQPYFLNIYSKIHSFYPHLKSFALITPQDKISYSQDVIYYTNPNDGESNRSFIYLNDAFKYAHSDLEKSVNECLSMPILLQCNERVITLLTELKLNKLTNNLLEIYKDREIIYDQQIAYFGLYKNYLEFSKYYDFLAEITNSRVADKLIKLSIEEQEKYISEIVTIKKQCIKEHPGRIYKGNKRIQ